MKTVSKKEIRLSVQTALSEIVGSLEIQKPSRKTEKLIQKTSKKISRELEAQLKKKLRKMEKAGKAVKVEKKKRWKRPEPVNRKYASCPARIRSGRRGQKAAVCAVPGFHFLQKQTLIPEQCTKVVSKALPTPLLISLPGHSISL